MTIPPTWKRIGLLTALVGQFLLPGGILPSAIAHAQPVLFVDDDSAGGDGSSWGAAYPTLQDALAAAGVGDEIWVAAGTYRPDDGGGQTPGDRAATFQLLSGVAVYGHFAGTEGSLAERDLTNLSDPSRKTVLSGDLNGDDLSGGSIIENSNHVVTSNGTDASAVLDGFTVSGGNANSGGGSAFLGGGLHNDDGSPTVRNCTFTGNTAVGGAGVYNGTGSLVLIDCAITDNTAEDIGAGMYDLDGTPTLIGCTFSGNWINHHAGGMAEMFGRSELINCTFDGNTAGDRGGGMYVFDVAARPKLTNCLFTGNSAGTDGGGIHDRGGALLTNCTFTKNSSVGSGGGMYNVIGSAFLNNCIFWANSDGGGTGEAAQITSIGASTQVNYSCVQGWTGGLSGVGSIGGDPLFVNSSAGNYRLSGESPCIDAGNSDAVPAAVLTDLDGNLRLFDDPGTPDGGSGTAPIVDMGTYEFGAPAGPVCGDGIAEMGEQCDGADDGACPGECRFNCTCPPPPTTTTTTTTQPPTTSTTSTASTSTTATQASTTSSTSTASTSTTATQPSTTTTTVPPGCPPGTNCFTVLGKKIQIKGNPGSQRRAVSVLGKEKATDIGNSGDRGLDAADDPLANGATLTIIFSADPGGSDSQESYSLTGAFAGSGSPGWRAFTTGFKYMDPRNVKGPVKTVLIRRTSGNTFQLKAVIRGFAPEAGTLPQVSVLPPDPGGSAALMLELGGGGNRYCIQWGGAAGGRVVRNDATAYKVINATSEPGCPIP